MLSKEIFIDYKSMEIKPVSKNYDYNICITLSIKKYLHMNSQVFVSKIIIIRKNFKLLKFNVNQ